MQRCPHHDDLVIEVGRLCHKMDTMHEDLLDIREDLYERGNGGVMGWMHQKKGAAQSRTVVTAAAISVGVSVLSATTVLLITKILS